MITFKDVQALHPELNRREKAMMKLYVEYLGAEKGWDQASCLAELRGFMLGVEACCKVSEPRQRREIETILERIHASKGK